MKFSIIIPSFNQDRFLSETLSNVRELKSIVTALGHELEVMIFDNNSNNEVQKIIDDNKDIFEFIDISADRGQYDAINKGIKKISGDYWTWLNTDDLIDVDGFQRVIHILEKHKEIDYIYGGIEVIDENSKRIRIVKAIELNLNDLVNKDPGIYQPGSFFRKRFTDKIGELKNYRCCFDYEYILRLLKNKARFHKCEFEVAQFRLYSDSKSGSIVPVFIKEQLSISIEYGRRKLSKLGMVSKLRLMKRKYLR